MKKFHSNSMKAMAYSASAIALVIAGPAFAQDAEADDEAPSGIIQDNGEEVDVTTDASGRATEGGNITVTGSRIVRDTYSSISPLQVLTTENQQAVGAFDPAQILQRSEAAAGQQIDATFQGFVLDNGPGSQTLNLRGLGANRNLLLLNGRRISPGGVEGAPSNPSINLIPATLVDRFDILTDGASSIYGSDAVAGVVNVILRKDFDGLEIQANGDYNERGGGNDFTVSAAWGFNTDRAVFGIGAEWRRTDQILLEDRDFLAGCDRHYEIDQNGNILTNDQATNAIALSRSNGAVGTLVQPCKFVGVAGRVQLSGPPGTRLGDVYFDQRQYGRTLNGQPIAGNTGVPGYSDTANAFLTPVDANGDGFQDIDFFDYSRNGAQPNQVFIPQEDVYNVFTYGEYTFPGAANITPFFEAGYTRSDLNQPNGAQGQFFPWVPSNNAFNPCNLAQPSGVNCRAIDNNFQELLPGQANNGAASILSTGQSLAVRPILLVRGDRNNFERRQEQYRGVLGVRGDLPFIGSSWTFEASGVYSRSEGSVIRRGIREDRLALAIGLDPTGDYDGDGVVDNDGDGIADDYISQAANNPALLAAGGLGAGTPCNTAGLRNPSLVAPDLLAGCVPVNLFAPSLFEGLIGDFASQAERDYLFGERDFDTVYEQKIISGYVTGDLFELPAGPVGVVLGAEWREDSIDSQPGIEASNGLFWGFFADGGASGSKWIRELYGEIDVPLMAAQPMVEELTVNVSGRLTDEEFYGTNGTFALKGGWRPVSPLLLKFSYGTSFRAPNLRENFLFNQSGFGNISDPCAVPTAAFNAGTGLYVPESDERDPAIIRNCQREGRDPFTVGIDQNGLNTIQVSSTQIFTGGSLDVDPETSRSITTGFAFEEDWASGFRFALNFNYYDIKLKDSIIEPSGQFIVNDCYTREDETRSPFCDRIQVSDQVASRFLITTVNSGFLNRAEESVRGIDLNTTFGYPVMIGGSEIDLSLNLTANHLIERSTTDVDDNGVPDTEDFAGEFGFPSWIGRATFNARYDDFLFTWQTRYIGRVDQDPLGVDELSDAFGRGPDGLPAGVVGDTCTGNGSGAVVGGAFVPNNIVPGDGVFCRDVGFAEEYFEHTASVRWDNGKFRIIAGVTNLFDDLPPLVDSSEVLAIANVPIGNGYNLNGREFFAQLLYRF
ncbi:MAG: TonB-dependent receptor plug domain-containing protein [Sphingomonadales bacterium]|nr:TonB-dependent receptor plug domain-containing protein [Sphingomonadales bacterium]NCQ20786.1 TonB-dependent receptor plug domain-containing protein [Sphingomonadales bacterium]NCT03785.1 TonB-dependent receptor plug domain-containing protein [Sphingomonadales bacterium]